MAEVRAIDGDVGAAWDELALGVGASVFARPGWLAAWAGAFGKAGALRALTVHRGGRLVGVLPVLASRFRVGTPLNGETALIAPVVADAEAAGELAEWLLARRVPVDLDGVLAEDPVTAAVRDGAGRVGTPVLEAHRCSSPYIGTVGDPASFLKGLSKNRRRGLTRLQNRLEETGEVVFEIDDGRDGDLAAKLAEGFRLEAREWKLAAGSAILSSTASVAFYTAGARWAAVEGLLRLAFLRVDGRAIASGYCLQQGRTLSFLKLGMDDELAKLGPGVLITKYLVEHAHTEAEVEELDLLGENAPWKADLASGVREQVRLRVYPTPGVGGVQRAATAAVGDLREAAVAHLSDGTRERLSAVRNRLRR
jgi:CelD/BcsL family acetyltransferase involved in cellulose biosynthesis